MAAKIETPDSRITDPETTRPRLPGWLRAVLVPVLFLATLLAVQLLFTLIPGANDALAAEGALPVLLNVVAALLVTLAIVGVIALLMRFVDRAPLARMGLVWTRHSLPALGIGLLLTVALTQAVLWVGVPLGQIERVATPPLTASLVASTVIIGLSRAFLLQGIPEELFYRGYLMQTLATRPRTAAWASAALFAVIHVVSSGGQQNVLDRILYLCIPFGFGLLAAALLLRTRSVWSAVGVHAGFHVSTLIGQFGGLAAQGRYFWVSTGAVLLIAGLVVLRGYRGDRVLIDR